MYNLHKIVRLMVFDKCIYFVTEHLKRHSPVKNSPGKNTGVG